MLFVTVKLLSETLFHFENPVFWIKLSYFDFWNNGAGDRIQALGDPKMCWMNILRTTVAVQRKGLDRTGCRHVVGPCEQVLPRNNAEICPLNEMSARLMMGRVKNEEMSLVLIFHRSNEVVIWEPGLPACAFT
jgi:hypothetical protein